MIDATKLLAALPSGLRDPLVAEYRGIVQAYAEGRWKLAGLDGGRFCEVVYSILEGALSGAYAAAPSKPARFPEACRALENKPPIAVGDRSLRILIPRVLPGLYEIRNNRDIGHVGGDVSPNKMDATYVRDGATWVMAELVRVFHGVPTAEAQESVDALVERKHPLVWDNGDVRRVLAPEMPASDKTLVLLHSSTGWCAVSDLQKWTKYKNNYAGQVLGPLADKLLIEVDENGKRAMLTPLGSERVEKKLL